MIKICWEQNYTDTNKWFLLLVSEKNQQFSWMPHTSECDYGLVQRTLVFLKKIKMDGGKKDGEMWVGELQLEFSHWLILTSIDLHPSLLLVLWWREEKKGTLSVGSCPEAPDLKQDEGYSACVQSGSGEKAASWQDIRDSVPSSARYSPAQTP